jgi:hypothetical protein
MLFLTSCGTINIDKVNSDLMPKSVAMSIFEKYGYRQWAEKPFVSSQAFCGNEKEYIEFTQLKKARYTPTSKSLHLFIDESNSAHICPTKMFSFNNLTESQALELTNAARALGATKIEKLDWLRLY